MKKLSLNLDELQVESFATAEPAARRGTVHGAAMAYCPYCCCPCCCSGWQSCGGTCDAAYTCEQAITCGTTDVSHCETCQTCGEWTCDYSECNGSCQTCEDTCDFSMCMTCYGTCSYVAAEEEMRACCW